ncbi:MAG: hypothetical protein ACP5N3_01990 [Candidatus Nanoarchaeia archaeon]
MASKNIAVKKKKKVWLSVHSPDFMGNVFLGESHVYGKEDLIGKTLNLNLATVTNDMKKQNINVTFRIVDVADNKGKTIITNYVLSPSYIKRLVRRKRDKIEDSFLAKTKDGKVVRVKPIAITNSDTYNSIISKVRLGMKAIIKNSLKEKTFEEFVQDLTSMKFQKEMRDKLNKIYPLKYVDVRQILLEEKGKVKEENISEEFLAVNKEESDEDSEVLDEDAQEETETESEDLEEDK